MHPSNHFASVSGITNSVATEHDFDPLAWTQVDYLGTNDGPEAVGSHTAGPSQMQPCASQPSFNHIMDVDLSEFLCSLSAPICQDACHTGELGGENTGETPQTHIEFKMLRPVPLDEKPIEHRRDNQVILEISVTPQSGQASIPWDSIRASGSNSARHTLIHDGRTSLKLTLGVCGATTGTTFLSACGKCSTRASSASPNLSLFAFIAKDGLIEIKGGKARVAFRFLCQPAHHGTTDTEYRLSATISGSGQIPARHTFDNWFRIVSHSRRRRDTSSTTQPPSIEDPGVSGNLTDSQVALPTRVRPEAALQGPVREETSSLYQHNLWPPLSQGSTEAPASTPPLNEGSEQTSPSQASAVPMSGGELPVLSRVNPRRGPTSGSDEIDLIVSNLSPMI